MWLRWNFSDHSSCGHISKVTDVIMAIWCWDYVGHTGVKHMIMDSLHCKCVAACTTGTKPAAPEEQSSESLALLSEIGISPSASLRGEGGGENWRRRRREGVHHAIRGSSSSDKYIATHPTGPAVWDRSLMWACLSCTTTGGGGVPGAPVLSPGCTFESFRGF